jgi:uncharacterized protein with NRDE domain
MCLIVFAYDCHPVYQLIVVANRDEFRDRPTEAAGFWSSAPYVLAGRDVKGGGTWMGITTSGKFASITNYRDQRLQVVDPPSRGRLVSDYLLNPHLAPQEYQAQLNRDGHRYDGFNLLYGSNDMLYYFTNRGGSSGPVSPGIHGLSNHLLDTRWAKVTTAKSRLETIVQQSNIDPEELFEALFDPAPYADNLLPDTGVGIERERMLSPLFIENDVYGTRSSTVLLVNRNGHVSFTERVFDYPVTSSVSQNFNFQIRNPSP